MNAADLCMNQVLLQDQGKLMISPLVHLVSFGIWADTELKIKTLFYCIWNSISNCQNISPQLDNGIIESSRMEKNSKIT